MSRLGRSPHVGAQDHAPPWRLEAQLTDNRTHSCRAPERHGVRRVHGSDQVSLRVPGPERGSSINSCTRIPRVNAGNGEPTLDQRAPKRVRERQSRSLRRRGERLFPFARITLNRDQQMVGRASHVHLRAATKMLPYRSDGQRSRATLHRAPGSPHWTGRSPASSRSLRNSGIVKRCRWPPSQP